ncbi:RraA family protein [Actinoplanes couchii]|uniref:Putative 4-hydroxy-4-methyl-2-oxoglutarate aldolase n=1 Tax=Actinoplanes couchii TaxID=403638 RepID=A0ABQ3XSJ9_9ACTN|nr:RraA family protein [Actinoplanes couchii]MDR6315969.1 4-hydroxy-4-methyl-2-oxoglutarate aldolase [Actinoplanes couchii]GID61487.1 4-carboxy-4-hydroxy-2-oxoadipate aldolase [Actinoplanes couchii]
MTTIDHGRILRLGSSTLFEAGRAAGATDILDPAIRPLWNGAAVCGPAYPVTCDSADNLAVHRAVELCEPGGVLMVNGWGVAAGYWGEILTAAAQFQGIAGVVIDGGARDLDGLRARGFPVFARTIGMRGAAKRSPGETGQRAKVGGVTVESGDLVVADTDGVLVVRRSMVSKVTADAEERVRYENELLNRVTKGERTLDLLQLRATLD